MMATRNPTEAGAATVMPPHNMQASSLTTNMAASSLTASGNSCLDEQIERLKRCEYLREGEVKALCLRAREILVDESNVQRVDAPVTVGSDSGNVDTFEYRRKRRRGPRFVFHYSVAGTSLTHTQTRFPDQ